jgi:hypothetical protein
MKQVYKRLGFGALAVISLLTSLLALFPVGVSAAGETFTWKDYNTFTVSGGDLKGSYDYKMVQGSNPQKFSPAGGTNFPEHEAGCDLGFTVILSSDSAGKIEYKLPSEPSGPSARPEGAVYCNDVKYKEVCSGIWPFRDCHFEYDGPKFPGVSEDYSGRSITIGGTRPGSNEQTETEQDKEVTVIVNSPNPNSSSAETIGMQIKDASGKVVATAQPAKEPALGSDDPNSDRFVDPAYQPVYYLHTFKLNPGDYTVCADIVIADCKAFKKEKFKSLILEYGDDSTARQIKVTVIATYIGGPKDLTVGPFEVNLRKPGGQIISQETDTQTHKMTEEEEWANGGITVEYELFTRTTFNGLDPATYEICVVGIEECQDVVKKAGETAEVTFTLDWNQYNADNTYERDCKDKYEVMGVKAITFVVCSIIDTGTYAVGALDSLIADLLTIDTNDIFDDGDTSNAYHTAWNSFRAFALGLIVIVALVMVVSQAAGVAILDAYTVRKVLPRLLFAAVFIALSWDILEFLVSLSNDAGNGIRGLIYAPFKSMADLGGSIGGGSLFALTLIGTGAALAFGWIGLLSFVITGLLASLVAAFVLVVRKIIIILIILLSPFAIAASILPNTRKLYDTWKGTLIALLVVFPIIMAFIAIGRVFAVVSFHAPGSQTVNQLIAIVAYFAPYFLITTAFKMAGGVISTLGGLASDRTKGAFDRLRGYRGNKVSENMSKMGQGQRFQGSNPLARGFNSLTFGATTAAKSNVKATLANPMNYLTKNGRRRRQLAWANAMGQQRNLNAMAYAKSDAMQVARFNDMLMRAQSYANASEALAHMGNDFGLDDKTVQNAVNQAKANGGFGRNQQLAAVRGLFATGTGYDNLKQAAEAIHRVAGDNDEMAMSLIGEGNFVSMDPAKGTGRADLGITFMGHVKLQQELRQKGYLTQADIDEGYVEAAKNNDAYTITTGKPKATQNIMPALTRALDAAQRTANDPNAGYNENGESLQALAKQEAGRLAGIIENIQSSGGYYGSAVVRGNISNAAEDSIDLRQDVQRDASQFELDRDPTTGNLVRRRIQNPANPTDPTDTIPQLKTPDADVKHGYDEQRPMR